MLRNTNYNSKTNTGVGGGGAGGGGVGAGVGGVFDYGAGGKWVSEGSVWGGWNWRIAGDGMLYLSMMVIQGETRPEAQAAAVRSDVIRHGKFFVFQLWDLRGITAIGAGGGRGRMTFGGAGLSPMDPARPLRSNSRVIFCNILVIQI